MEGEGTRLAPGCGGRVSEVEPGIMEPVDRHLDEAMREMGTRRPQGSSPWWVACGMGASDLKTEFISRPEFLQLWAMLALRKTPRVTYVKDDIAAFLEEIPMSPLRQWQHL